MRKALVPVLFFLTLVLLFEYGTLAIHFTYMPGGTLFVPQWLGTFACGACCLIAVYSLSLYLQKRSERYLLWLFFIAAIAFFRTLLGSMPLSSVDISMVGTALDIFTVVICYALCFWITGTTLPGKWAFFLTAPGLFLIYATLIAVRYTIPATFTQRLIASLPYMAALGCLGTACLEKKPYAYLLLFGIASRYGLRAYLLLAAQSPLHGYTLYHYISYSQLDFFIFVLCCLFAINGKFVSKFNESDRLVEALAQANTGLDAKVAQRTQELREANEELLREQAQRHAMMTNIFHDLRSPVFVLQGYMDMLGYTEEEHAHKITVMRERLLFLSRLIEDLFLLAKLEEKQITFEKEYMDTEAICAHALEAATPLAAAQNVTLSLCAEPNCRMRGDAFRLSQALQNLLENALQHTPENGQVTLRIDKAASSVRIHVQDTGHGIPQAELANVFDRYYKRPRKSSSSSSGLGLNIVRHIVTNMGGTIRVESKKDIGSTFTMEFPETETRE